MVVGIRCMCRRKMTQYNTCLRCGSIDIECKTVTVVDSNDNANELAEWTCESCGLAERVVCGSGKLTDRFQNFDSCGVGKIKQLQT